MVRLTPELIEDSFQYVNPVREYELGLRGKLMPEPNVIFLAKLIQTTSRLQDWFDREFGRHIESI